MLITIFGYVLMDDWPAQVQAITSVVTMIGTLVYVIFTYRIMLWAMRQGESAIKATELQAEAAERSLALTLVEMEKYSRDIHNHDMDLWGGIDRWEKSGWSEEVREDVMQCLEGLRDTVANARGLAVPGAYRVTLNDIDTLSLIMQTMVRLDEHDVAGRQRTMNIIRDMMLDDMARIESMLEDWSDKLQRRKA